MTPMRTTYEIRLFKWMFWMVKCMKFQIGGYVYRTVTELAVVWANLLPFVKYDPSVFWGGGAKMVS